MYQLSPWCELGKGGNSMFKTKRKNLIAAIAAALMVGVASTSFAGDQTVLKFSTMEPPQGRW
jgi:hypothetical protein